MRIGIVGAGATGLTAAHDLVKAGHDVVLLERSAELGGLAASIEVGGTPLERFYHHIFATDKDIIALIEELGLADDLVFAATTTGIYLDGKTIDFSTPQDMLRFPPIRFHDRVRFGVSSAALKVIRRGERLGDRSALAWTRRWAGKAATEAIWEPLLRGKFGPHAERISMAWLWARIHFRTFKLGYLVGGFDRLYEGLAARIGAAGGKIVYGQALERITQENADAPVVVRTGDGSTYEFDRVLVTTPQPTLAAALGADPEHQLWRNQYLGATCFILECDRSVIPHYWLNINDPEFPFLAVVEHTHLRPTDEYGGNHILYIGNYVDREDWRFTTEPDELLEKFVPWLRKLNPDFDLSWVRKRHFSRAPFAQPIVTPEYRDRIPPHETALPGVFLATMSQVYPQDRGQNYAIKMAHHVVKRYLTA